MAMGDDVYNLLGEVLVTCPATGSHLVDKEQLHTLLELTGGTVWLRRRRWRIVPRRHSSLHVRIELKEERQ